MVTTKDELYSHLLELRTIYQEKVVQMQDSATLDITGTGYSNHQADDATMVYDQTVSASTFRSVQARLRQVEDAIGRFEAGTYGVCDNCGGEIDIARLEAIPYTELCLRCAETRDFNAGI